MKLEQRLDNNSSNQMSTNRYFKSLFRKGFRGESTGKTVDYGAILICSKSLFDALQLCCTASLASLSSVCRPSFVVCGSRMYCGALSRRGKHFARIISPVSKLSACNLQNCNDLVQGKDVRNRG